MDAKRLLNSFDNGELKHIIDALPGVVAERDLELPAQLGGTIAATNTVEVETVPEETLKTKPIIDVLSLLSPEQAERAIRLTSAMAKKFSVDESDFSILALKTESSEKHITIAYDVVVVYSGSNGIHKGSWNEIMDKKSSKNFTVNVDHKNIDTREALTLDVYKAIVEKAIANGETLPDSRQLSDKNNQPWTWTLLTGEKSEAKITLDAPHAYVDDTDSARGPLVYDPTYDGEIVRFRPAVVL